VSFETVSLQDLGEDGNYSVYVDTNDYAYEGYFIKRGDTLNNEDNRIPDSCDAAVAQRGTPLPVETASGGYTYKRLVAAPNDAYLIDDVVDAIMPYTATTVTTGPTDALDPHKYYGDLLDSLRAELGDKLLLPVHWGLPMGTTEVDVHVVVDRLAVDVEKANGGIVFNYPISIHFKNDPDKRGLFHESAALTTDEGYQLMAQWPGRQNSLRGWYQRWTHISTVNEDVTITVMDKVNSIPDRQGNLFKAVSKNGTNVLAESDVYADDQLPESQTVKLIVGDELALSFRRANDQDGAVVDPVRVYFKYEWDPTKPEPAFVFQSGTSQPAVVTAFEEVRDFFLATRAAEVLPPSM
jgi:hypothetical protein